jgi:hypothetical protein
MMTPRPTVTKRVGTSMRSATPIQKSEKMIAATREKARTERVKVKKKRRGGREIVRVERKNVCRRRRSN